MAESAGLDLESTEGAIELGEKSSYKVVSAPLVMNGGYWLTTDAIEDVVCECRASVRRRDGGQGKDIDVEGFESTDHIASVKTADNVH